jgi:hypothetical protein
MGPEQGLVADCAPMRQAENRLKGAIEPDIAKPASGVPIFLTDEWLNMVKQE